MKHGLRHHYDVGIYGWWGHENFGGCLTYFALERTVKKLGYSVLMIQEANGLPGRYQIPDDCISMTHALKEYDCAPQTDIKELSKYNDICDRFIIGGDQMWNPRLPFVRSDCFLDFVNDKKIKISYSTSFGPASHSPSQGYINTMAPLLRRFDAISVREDYAVDIAKNIYGAKAKQIIDAVFLPDPSEYLKVASYADCQLPKNYLVAFILNPSIEKRNQIEEIAKKLNLEIVCIPDAAAALHPSFNEVFKGLTIMSPLSVSNFIKAYAGAKYVVTDSFHGTCMSYVFKKPFNVYFNEQRGADRFVSLMKLLHLENRRIYENDSVAQIADNKNISFSIDWTPADKTVSQEKESALAWLKQSLENKSESKYPSEIYNPEAQKLLSNPDFIKIRMLATLLRDYGVKHVVLSPGGRDVPLIRLFENNEHFFTLHSVTDERSAAYFGLGLAAQLQSPVACVCTSGTAASNYLPAVTEAYYTGVPLIMITADRYGVFLNHGEDQTIPQKDIFRNVIKKAISLPENAGYYPEYQVRRDISDCILEATHNGFGPVHINVPIDNITIGEKAPKEQWRLLPFVYPHILRASFTEGETNMLRWVDSLKKSPRILVVYGQNAPLTSEQQNNVDAFAEKYNCVIVTDPISNFNNKYTIQPYNMLNQISQQEFDEHLAPDILITVGGKRLMNDPLTFKIRNSKANIRHWQVSPNGTIKDFYFKLSSVIESTQDNFFRWFASRAGFASNNLMYYNAWKRIFEAHKTPRFIGGFNAHYVQRNLAELLPGNSMLHLGVGQSFFDIRRYNLKPEVQVFCNMGTNGIDGCTSAFLGQCAVEKEKMCVLLVGDLSFFYDMNSIWNKQVGPNVRIILVNNNGTDLLRSHNLKAVSSVHNTLAEGWVRSNPSFEYLSARTPQEFDKEIRYVLSADPKKAVFLEVICD